MEFCIKCGSLLEPQKIESGNAAPIALVCTKCGHQKHEYKKVLPKIIKIKTMLHDPKQCVAVIGKEEQQLRTLPTIKIKMH